MKKMIKKSFIIITLLFSLTLFGCKKGNAKIEIVLSCVLFHSSTSFSSVLYGLGFAADF
ncbi:MAG: hypothetical protein GX931_02765, partial [Acholeplasmataceae bacterium]|nr:hypothetical protein [Acholeplasmataceae bacterium]